MATYNNNSQIRSLTASTVRSSFGPIVLLKLAHSTVCSLFFLFISLIAAPLKVGYTRGLIELVRGSVPKVGVVFSRFRQFLACILLPAWTTLKMLAWLLPGLLIAIIGALIAATGREDFLMAIGAVISVAGGIMFFVWGIQAYYRYKMAHIAFADNPDLDVYNAVEYSKKMMNGRKFQLFCLTIPYLLFKLLIVLSLGALIFIVTQLMYDLGSLAFLGVILVFAAVIAAIAGFIYISLLEELALICFYDVNRS